MTTVEKIVSDDVPKENKFLLIINVKDKPISGSKRFVSIQNFLQLSKSIGKEFTNGEGNEIVLKLVDAKNHHVKNIKVKMNVKGRETIDKIKQRLMDLDEVINIPDEEKYRIVIDNCESSKVDKRAFSMRFKGTIQDCYACMRNFFEDTIKEINDDEIVFQDDNKSKKATHRVIIHKSGSAENYKKFKSKSFSINLPNYSSEEIIEVVRRRIQCEKKK